MQVTGDVIGRFRPPVSIMLPFAAMFAVLALMFRVLGWPPMGWLFPVMFLTIFALGRSRQGLTVTTAGVASTRIGTRFIAWEEIRGFRPASVWRGGIWIDTDSWPVSSLAPCSWWGGPPDAASLRQLEALRPRQHTPPG